MGTVPPELTDTQAARPHDTAPQIPPTMREPGAEPPAPQVGERRPSTSPAEVVIAKMANGTLSLEATPRLAPENVGATMLSVPDPLAPRPAGEGPPTLVTGRAPEPGRVTPPRAPMPSHAAARPAETLAGNVAPVPPGWTPVRPRPSQAPAIAAALGIGSAVLVGGAIVLAVATAEKRGTEPSGTTTTVSTDAVPSPTPTEAVLAADTPPIVPAPALPTASASSPSRARTTATAQPPVPTPGPTAGPETSVCRSYRELSGKKIANPATLRALAAKCKATGGNVETGF